MMIVFYATSLYTMEPSQPSNPNIGDPKFNRYNWIMAYYKNRKYQSTAANKTHNNSFLYNTYPAPIEEPKEKIHRCVSEPDELHRQAWPPIDG